jgi:hypothetical protein
MAAPSRVYIRCPTHGLFCVGGLDEGKVETGAGLKALIYERLMLRPTQAIRLTSWGRELKDGDRLSAFAIQASAVPSQEGPMAWPSLNFLPLERAAEGHIAASRRGVAISASSACDAGVPLASLDRAHCRLSTRKHACTAPIIAPSPAPLRSLAPNPPLRPTRS